MKKKLFVIATSLLIAFSSIPSFAANAEPQKATEMYSLYEIQEILENYIQENQLNLTIGTEEFYNFTIEQLIGDNPDETLKAHEQYDLIHAYLVEYLVTVDSEMIENDRISTFSKTTPSNIYEMPTAELNKTIGDIIDENNSREAMDNNENEISLYSSSYDGDAAAEYAIEYAYIYNGNFTAYSSDCTNFVSQAINAGGIDMHGSRAGGIEDTTNEWYHYRYISDYHGNTPVYSTDVTTSFIRVADFVTYITPQSTKKTCSTHNALISGCNVGDVFFAADKTTKTPYHAMIITNQDSNGTYYSGHTTNRKNKNVTTIDLSDDVLIRFQID